ncbi:2-methoxy-6-polyprenyl-1,4-benzoquinol methylase, mitochondrial [Daldinia childiae]|uniref:2-methoxy-6-polyprenyl-1,4-benzoquinol methylase, mitochondrial n=1 Tax=Daldinia childiae TaxID=326645 RepID=UPI001444F1E4|nr:2-methoxy-6-polyprenyl-1,4-benzoquinol methylase, mitochondrial [Daldinia childiae]KAF3061679.1 2-methoxy-6-polyprenyl-1,4-benzoquinol methylase, mitochondrial [Daldinia childiae]
MVDYSAQRHVTHDPSSLKTLPLLLPPNHIPPPTMAPAVAVEIAVQPLRLPRRPLRVREDGARSRRLPQRSRVLRPHERPYVIWLAPGLEGPLRLLPQPGPVLLHAPQTPTHPRRSRRHRRHRLPHAAPRARAQPQPRRPRHHLRHQPLHASSRQAALPLPTRLATSRAILPRSRRDQLPPAAVPDASLDLYTVAFGIRNFSNIPAALAEAHRVLKPGGVFACLEFSKVGNPLLDAVYKRWSFSAIPLIGHLVAGDRDSYQYLVESIERFPSQTQFRDMIKHAGFVVGGQGWEDLTGGVAAIHKGMKPL